MDDDNKYTIDLSDISLDDDLSYTGDVTVSIGYDEYASPWYGWNNDHTNERLTAIEQALGLPKRDFELERAYPELRELYEAQIEKVKQAVASVDHSAYNEACDKKRAWDILNK